MKWTDLPTTFHFREGESRWVLVEDFDGPCQLVSDDGGPFVTVAVTQWQAPDVERGDRFEVPRTSVRREP